MHTDLPVQVYEPRRQTHLGWRVWAEMLREMVQARELLWRLIWRDIVARYKQTFLGVAVGVLGPLALLAVFVLLRRGGVFPIAEDPDIPYPLAVYLGLLPWQMFSMGLTRATSSLVLSAELVGKVRFPRETLVLASLGQAIFDFLLGVPVLVVLFLIFGRAPAWTIVLVPLVLIVLLVLMSGLGFVLSMLNAAVRDVGNVLPALLIVGMFLAPVIYPPVQTWPMSLVNWLNPVAPLIASIRDLAVLGRISLPGPLVVSVLASLVIGLGGWRLFHRLEPKMAERV